MKKRIRGIILSAVLAFSVIPVMPTALAADKTTSTASTTYQVPFASSNEARTVFYDLEVAQSTDISNILSNENSGRTHQLIYDNTLEADAIQRAKEIAIFFSNTRPDGNGSPAAKETIASGNSSLATTLVVPDDAVYYTAIGHVIYNGTDYWAQLYNTAGTGGAFSSSSVSSVTVSTRILKAYMLGNYTIVQTPGDISVKSGESTVLPTYTIGLKTNDGVHNTDETACVLKASNANTVTWKSGIGAIARVANGEVTGYNVGSSELSADINITSLDSKTIKSKVTVTQADLSDAYLDMANSYALNGSKAEPKPKVTLTNGTVLTENVDYTLEYKSNTAVGTGTVTAKGIGNYTGTASRNFAVTADPGGSISSATLALAKTDAIVYDGTEKKPEVTLTRNGAVLDATNYDLTYSNNIKAGTATVTAAGKGIYSGTKSMTFKIEQASLKDATITFGATKYTYTGSEIKPTITVKAGNVDVAAEDYTTTYKNNTSVSTSTTKASVTITGKGNFKDSKTAEFTIEKGTLTGGRIEFLNESTMNYEQTYSVAYDGKVHVPTMRVTLNDGADWVNASLYTLTTTGDTTNAGTVNVTATGKGDFSGSEIKGTYTITPLDGEKLTMSNVSAKSFTGKEITPTVTIKSGALTLKAETDYTLSYDSNIYPGTATVTATFKGNYTGSLSKTFKISMKKPVIGNVSGGKKRLTVSWSKPAGAFKKYQVQYAKSSSMSGSTKVMVAKSKSSLTVKKLAKGTYYVRVRTYYKDDSGTYYSGWSAKKKVTVS